MKPAAAKPFLFEQSFDEEAMQRARERKLQEKEEAKLAAERAEQEQNPPPPTFSEEELQSAQAAAWQEGHQAGMTDAEKQKEAQTLALLENLGAQVSGMHVHQDLANERIAAELSSFALEVCRRILPTFVEAQGGEELRALLGECLEKITPASRILIAVSPDTLELLEPQIDGLAARSGFEGRMKLVADPTLGPTDLIATWDGGNMQRIEQDIWDGIDAVVARTRNAAPAAPDLSQIDEPAEASPQQAVQDGVAPETGSEQSDIPADVIAETAVSEEDQNV